MEHEAAKKKPLSGFKLFILIILGFIVLSFVLQMTGMKVMNVKENDEVIERPHG